MSGHLTVGIDGANREDVMRLLIILCSVFLLASCSFGGFKPPRAYDVWILKTTGSNTDYDWFDRRNKDMRACGMDPVLGESSYAKVNLCLEQKGWYLAGGPVCENELNWTDKECIEWRKKHSAPDVKPWSPKENSDYITKILGLEQAPMTEEAKRLMRMREKTWWEKLLGL